VTKVGRRRLWRWNHALRVSEAVQKQNASPGLYLIPFVKDQKETQQPEVRD
jgi:hypothetical protein